MVLKQRQSVSKDAKKLKTNRKRDQLVKNRGCQLYDKGERRTGQSQRLHNNAHGHWTRGGELVKKPLRLDDSAPKYDNLVEGVVDKEEEGTVEGDVEEGGH